MRSGAVAAAILILACAAGPPPARRPPTRARAPPSGAGDPSLLSSARALLFETERSGMAAVFARLEQAGLDPDTTDEKGYPLLVTAVERDRIDVAAWLLERGADVNARIRMGAGTYLYLPAIASPMDPPVQEPLEWARLFLEHGADPNLRSSEGTALCYAAMSDRHHDLLVFLVEHGADVNLGDDDGLAPLGSATQNKCAKNVAYLKSKGARLHSYEYPVGNGAPPCRAVLAEDLAALASLPAEEFARMLARTALGVPATALHLAAERGSLRVLRALAARQVDWDVGDLYGRSPLHLAVLGGRAEAVAVLLEAGADPGFADALSTTPFSAACAARPAIARQMLAGGRVPAGEAALAAAVCSEDLDLVKALGAKVKWNGRAPQFAAKLGLVGITDHLCGLVPPAGRSRAELLEEARTNRRLIEEYEARGAAPLPPPARSGGIGEKRGTFPYVLESWSPWMEAAAVKSFADYPVGVYVPQHYDGSRPFGLLVSMTNAKSSSPYPRDFAPVLDRRDLIWVGFDPYNGLHTLGGDANLAFCLALVYNLLGHFNIDQSRLYIGGFSLGGQLTERVINRHPWPFKGALFINIDYMAYQAIDFAGGWPPQPHWYYNKKHMPFVFVEGDYDYNRRAAYMGYNRLLHAGYRDVHFVHEPLTAHKLIQAASFETALGLLEGDRR